jgi:protein-S-isoprenylcysteine O-methyltransferase Ste14
MWFYILLAVVVVLLAWWLSRTSLFRHWRGHSADPGGRNVGWHNGYDADGNNPGDRIG